MCGFLGSLNIISIPGFSEPVSSWTHLLAAGIAFLGTFFLMYKGRGNWLRLFALFVFSASLVFLFSMSGVFHLLEPGYLPRVVFQRLDHAAIWTLIAGTFTPLHLIALRGFWRWGILSFIWALGITGLVLEVVFFTDIPEWFLTCLFLGFGWFGVVTALKLGRIHGFKTINLLLWGGLAYTIGAIIEFLQWPTLISGVIRPHELFHIFVIAGAACHWLLIYRLADVPVINKLTFIVKERPGNDFWAHSLGDNIKVHAKSIEALRGSIMEKVKDRYPQNLPPESIYLQFLKEEVLQP